MCKVAIVDDCPLDREHLCSTLAKACPEVDIVYQFDSGASAMRLLPNLRLDALLLDVHLGDMCGLSLLGQMPNRNFKVIVTTAFSSYAIEAIRLSALDYLLKPIDGDELAKAIAKVPHQEHNNHLNPPDAANRIMANSIVVSERTKDHVIQIQSIIYLKSCGNYTQLVYSTDGVNERVVTGCYNLLYYESRLRAYGFVRIHQSILVNSMCIQSINRNTREVALPNGHKLTCSRNGIRLLKGVITGKAQL